MTNATIPSERSSLQVTWSLLSEATSYTTVDPHICVQSTTMATIPGAQAVMETTAMTETMAMTKTIAVTETIAMMEITHQVDRDRQVTMETTAMTKTARRVDRHHRGEEPRHRLHVQNEREHMSRQAALVPVHRREVLDTNLDWTSSTSRVPKRRTSTEPKSAEPSARKRQAIGKGKQRASETTSPAPSSLAYSSSSDEDEDPIIPYLAGPSARRK